MLRETLYIVVIHTRNLQVFKNAYDRTIIEWNTYRSPLKMTWRLEDHSGSQEVLTVPMRFIYNVTHRTSDW